MGLWALGIGYVGWVPGCAFLGGHVVISSLLKRGQGRKEKKKKKKKKKRERERERRRGTGGGTGVKRNVYVIPGWLLLPRTILRR